ncbi:glycosyltransferase [Gemmata sp. SH-PL17]|uniref:glycosyltransferase n=1 Tax=Gemmata sp. SH-PL17 TaxID=1630693 RepID=UPI0004BCEEC9|nr:glycosyltransferase [Gemmata sp. SH-PL17]
MNLVHLTASTFFGGPERQMLGLALALPEFVRTTFSTFSEGGRGGAFLEFVRAQGFATAPLKNDFPKVFAAVREVSDLLRATTCDVLICHGYKAHVLGRLAARRVGIPAVAVSRGWTGETGKVRAYEWIDRRHMQFMDHVVCVSEGQAEKVRRWCRIPANRLTVIRNSARLGAFERTDPTARARLSAFFGCDTSVSQIIVGAGRFSPEKGFGVLIEAARSIVTANPSAGVVLFGEGQLRGELERRIAELGLTGRVVLPGFRTDLDSLIGSADVVVLPSYTEGLPNVALEASAAGVPVVATAVGGTPEAIADNVNGFLVPPGSPADIANKVGELLRDAPLRTRFGAAGRDRMRELFTFQAQATAYLRLLNTLRPTPAEAVA